MFRTNIVLSNGSLFVEGITIGESPLIGHLCSLGCGNIVEKNVELGPHVNVGYRGMIKEGSKISARFGIEHRVVIRKSVAIGAMAYAGTVSTIGNDLKIPSGSIIPQRAKIMSEEDVARYASSVSQAYYEMKSSVKTDNGK